MGKGGGKAWILTDVAVVAGESQCICLMNNKRVVGNIGKNSTSYFQHAK